MTGKELVNEHLRAGWVIDRISGSHYIIEKNNITVPIPVHPGKDIRIGTLKSIIKITGLSLRSVK